MAIVGWRLTLEPCADLVAWSLLRTGVGPEVTAWSGLIEDAVPAREVARRLLVGSGRGDPDPATEADAARSLGSTLLPIELCRGLTAGTRPATLTICVRGWPASVPWQALVVDGADERLVERCVVLGGLAPGLLAEEPGDHRTARGPGVDDSQLWVVDPGPPEGSWPPLFPAGYPGEVTSLIGGGDRLVPDGAQFSRTELAGELIDRRWAGLVYLGHIGARESSPAATGLVLAGQSGADLLTAHDWLREPRRWPMPPRVALLGCGSDDAAALEHSGLVTAALKAGAGLVTATRWPLANGPGALRAFAAVANAHSVPAVHHALRDWQLGELDRWRRSAAPACSPHYWSSLVTYDRGLLQPRAESS